MSQRGGREESSADGVKMKGPRIDKTKRETIGRKEDTVTREAKRNETKDWWQEEEEEEKKEEGKKVPLVGEKEGKEEERKEEGPFACAWQCIEEEGWDK